MRSLSSSKVVVFGAVLAVALVVALFPFFPRQLPVHEGDVASSDIRSPLARTFESAVLTEQARDDAAQAVREVLRFEPSVPTAQMAALRAAIQDVSEVRSNDDLDAAGKRAQLLGISDLSGLSRRSIDTILGLSGDGWFVVSDEAEHTITIVTRDGAGGGAVTLPGIGKIACRARPERQVRNPQTQEMMTKPADKQVKVTIAKALKDSVNS